MTRYFYTVLFFLLSGYGLSAQAPDSIFGERQVIQTTTNPKSNSVFPSVKGFADINSDGLLDYYVLLGETIYWLENLGNGEFVEFTPLTDVYEGTTDVIFVDLDNDGELDLLYTSNREFRTDTKTFKEQAVYYRNNINGFFQRSVQITELTGGDRLHIYFVDIDGDSDLDIVTYHTHYEGGTATGSSFRLIENLGNLDFLEERMLIDNAPRFDTPIFIDINNDGIIDIVGRDRFIGLNYYLGTANREFSDAKQIQFPTPFDDTYTFEDLDQDGIQELIVSKLVRITGDGHYYRHENEMGYYSYQDGIYEKWGNLFRMDEYWIDEAIFIGINSDSNKDLLFRAGHMEGTDSDLWWSKRNSDFSFSDPIRTTIKLSPKQRIVGYIDLDNDGNPDALTDFVAQGDIYGVAWYKNKSPVRVDIEKPTGSLPTKTKLFKNYPNPFNPTTNFVFSLKTADRIEFRVFDSMGRSVATISPRLYNSGTHEVSFDASALSAGIYFYQMIGNKFIQTSKFTLLK